jgi:hypothetical protein
VTGRVSEACFRLREALRPPTDPHDEAAELAAWGHVDRAFELLREEARFELSVEERRALLEADVSTGDRLYALVSARDKLRASLAGEEGE